MNLLCPNCQKMLTVPEEFAGQLMKCPLCAGTFTVPGLPGAVPPPAIMPEPDIFPVQAEPAPSPSVSASTITNVEPPSAPSTAAMTSPPPNAVSLSPSSLLPEGYHHRLTLWISPKVLPWVAPVCLLLVFILLFFNWVGLYPGGVPSVTQNAWQAAFGLYTENGNLRHPPMQEERYKPGWSVLTFFYLLLFFPVLVVTFASVVLPLIHVKLPPGVEKIMPWRWGIVVAANLILFFFLALQLLLGFSLDSRYAEWVESKVKVDSKEPKSTPEQLKEKAARGQLFQVRHHTIWLRLVVLLHLAAIVCAALMFWVERRGPNRPLPKLELMW